MGDFYLDYEISRFMSENGCSETEATNILERNYDEIWICIEKEEE